MNILLVSKTAHAFLRCPAVAGLLTAPFALRLMQPIPLVLWLPTASQVALAVLSPMSGQAAGPHAIASR